MLIAETENVESSTFTPESLEVADFQVRVAAPHGDKFNPGRDVHEQLVLEFSKPGIQKKLVFKGIDGTLVDIEAAFLRLEQDFANNADLPIRAEVGNVSLSLEQRKGSVYLVVGKSGIQKNLKYTEVISVLDEIVDFFEDIDKPSQNIAGDVDQFKVESKSDLIDFMKDRVRETGGMEEQRLVNDATRVSCRTESKVRKIIRRLKQTGEFLEPRPRELKVID